MSKLTTFLKKMKLRGTVNLALKIFFLFFGLTDNDFDTTV